VNGREVVNAIQQGDTMLHVTIHEGSAGA
jgi:hypothetical protein